MTYGGDETLRTAIERFVERANSAGVDITLEVSEGMQHAYEYMAGRAREADRSIANVGQWLRPKLGLG